jgi:hypothetical protein
LIGGLVARLAILRPTSASAGRQRLLYFLGTFLNDLLFLTRCVCAKEDQCWLPGCLNAQQGMSEVIFIDATDWSELPWFSSGGTRAKRILQDPDGGIWFFKCSEKKEAKDGKPAKYYKYEFWSEIIAYQIGAELGLNVLRYEPAVYDGQIGCISRTMIDQNHQNLSEIGRYMMQFEPRFVPSNVKARNFYSFQLLRKTFKSYKFSRFWPQIFQTLLFDGIIGNTDRHQENWAVIVNFKVVAPFFEKHRLIGFRHLRQNICLFRRKIREKKLAFGFFAKMNKKLKRDGRMLNKEMHEKMAPIYDNGSSLGRELTDDRVLELIGEEAKLQKYIDNGPCELHWNGEKLSHFNFIGKLLASSYIQKVKRAGFFLNSWSDSCIAEIVRDIDKSLPEHLSEYRIPKNRKELIIKLLTLRAKKLREIVHGGV